MNKFKYKHTTLVWALLFIVLALAVASVVWNGIILIKKINLGANNLLSSALMLLVGVFLTAFCVSVLTACKYVVKKDKVVLRFGFIPTTYAIQDVVQFTHFKKSDKLVMYFQDATYTVIVISPTQYQAFVDSIRKQNSKIIFDFESEDLLDA